MYKLVSFVSIFFLTTLSADGHLSLFFSEYGEGSSNNKYLEIYNGTGVDVDLSEYTVSSCNNGCDIEGQFDYLNNFGFAPGTILPHGEVYIICHPSASNGIEAECDQEFTYLSNGDDFFALTKAGANTDEDEVVFTGEFGGAIDLPVLDSSDDVIGGTYLVPSTAESWAGFANEDASMYPIAFPNGGKISFTGNTAGGDIDVYFRFEYMPFPDVEPSYNTVPVTIVGTDPTGYTIDIPSQGENTYSSFLFYVNASDASVTITDLNVYSYPEVVDKIGDFGPDPGNGWAVAGTSNGTKDHTLVRKSYVREGSVDWSASAGTDATDSQWIVNERPTANYTPSTLGSHFNGCENPNLAVSIEMYDSFGDGWGDGTYTVTGLDGAVVSSGTLSSGSFGVDTLCLYEGVFSITVGGDLFDNEISFAIVDAFENTLYFGGAGSATFAVTGVNQIVGCTDPTAVNFDSDADVDNGSCYYEGEVCEAPFSIVPTTNEDGNAESYGTADATTEQWFKYTVQETGNLTVSTVGLTDQDTYVSLLTSCAIDSQLVDDEMTYFYVDEIAWSDDVVIGTSISYQSEVSVCVTAGDEIYIAWLPIWTTDGDFQFAVYESPDITTPVNVFADGQEGGIAVSWNQIPVGCVSTDAEPEARSSRREYEPVMLKSGEIRSLKPGFPLRSSGFYANNSRSVDFQINEPIRSLNRDCPDGSTEVTFVSVCGGSNCFESEQSYSIVGSDGTVYISETETSGATQTPVDICLVDGDYTVTLYDSWGDGWNSGVLNVLVDGSAVYTLTMSGSQGDPPGDQISGAFTLNSSAVYGCTDPDAANYDPAATDDDGSCYFIGDLCSAPVVVNDATVGVTNGDAEFYSVSISSSPGALTVTNTGSFGGTFNIYVDCDYSPSWPYDGQINYEYLSSGEVHVIDFSSASTADTDLPMDTYLGATVVVKSGTGDITFSYEEYVYGCTDPNASNYNPDATSDDGSCECASEVLVMTMYDSYGDGWNGNTYAIVDAAGTVVASGTMPDLAGGGLAYPYAEEICMPGDGSYSLYVASPPAEGGSISFPNYASEISWVLSTESGQTILSGGGAPFGADGDNTFPIPLPEFSFSVYRDGVVLAENIASPSYYDSTSIGGTTNLVAGQDYCYTVTQTNGIGADAVISDQSESSCAQIYVPSTCENAIMAELDSMNYIEGVYGRDEWFYHVPTQDGYLTITSDLPENDPLDNDTRLFVYTGACTSLVQIGYDDDGGEGYLSFETVPMYEGVPISILWTNNYSPGLSVWTLYETPHGVQPPGALTAVGDHERIHLSWWYPQMPMNVALQGISGSGNTIEENSRSISLREDASQKVNDRRLELAELASTSDNNSNSREIDQTSSIGVAGSILNEDGSADIIINFNLESSDISYADAIKYTFPEGVMINSAVDASGTMSPSTGSAGDCSITIDAETNSVIFGAADFQVTDDSGNVIADVWDPETGSGWGCLNLTVHQHVINVSAYTEEIDIDFYAADDCYQSCGDFSGTMTAPVPIDNPCFDDELEAVYDHILGEPDTYTPLANGPTYYPDLTICPSDFDAFLVDDIEYGGVIDLEVIDKAQSGVMWVFFWDLTIDEYPIFATNSTASGDTILFSYQNLTNPGISTDLVVGVFANESLDQTEYSFRSNVRPPEQYTYNIYDGATGALKADSIVGYHYVDVGLTNDQPYLYYAKTVNSVGHMSAASPTIIGTPLADVVTPPQNLVGSSSDLQQVELSWDAPLAFVPGDRIDTALPIDMLPFTSQGSTIGFENDYDVACNASSSSPDVVYAFTATTDTSISVSTCLSMYDTKVFVFESSADIVAGCDDDSWGSSGDPCGAWTSYIDSVSVTAGNTYYVVVDGWGGDAGNYQLDVYYRGDTSFPDGPSLLTTVVPSEYDLAERERAVADRLAALEETVNPSRSLNAYEVYRDGVSIGTTSAADPNMGRFYIDDSLVTSEEGISYSYYVTAIFDGGVSQPSNTVEVVPIHPLDVPEPVNVASSSNGWVVNLSWDSPDLPDTEYTFSESFDDGTLGAMSSEDLTGGNGAVFTVGTSASSSSSYWSPPEFGTYAYYNDDAQGGTAPAATIVLQSPVIDISGLSADEITGLTLMGDLYFTQPSGSCSGGSQYGEDLLLVIRYDDGDWVPRGFFEPTPGDWGPISRALDVPETATSVQVGIVYDDCGGNWGYGVGVDNFSIAIPPALELIGYGLYKDDVWLGSVGPNRNDYVDVVGVEGTYNYSVTSWFTLYGESDLVSSSVDVVSPGPMMNPPRDLTVSTNGLSAHLEWDHPVGVEQWLGYNNGEIGNMLGSTSFDWTIAVRIPAEDVVNYQGKHLKEVRFAGGENISQTSFRVAVMKSDQNSLIPELLYLSDVIPGANVTEGEWYYYELTEPVEVPMITEELWFGLTLTDPGGDEDPSLPIVIDNSSETFDGYSNLISFGGPAGPWGTLLQSGFQGNYLIEGYVTDPTSVIFSGEFGGAIDSANVYTNPTGAESWAGFANEDTDLYPFSFPDGGSITFMASAPDTADIYFRFEYMPYPDTEPSFNTAPVSITSREPAEYVVDIPSQGAFTFSSFLMYVTTLDVPVTLSHVMVHEHSGDGPVAMIELPDRRSTDLLSGPNDIVALFEEYTVEQNTRNHMMEFMGYKVYRNSVEVDMMEGSESSSYFDTVSVAESGMMEYAVAAMYHDMQTGTMDEAMSESVMGEVTNQAPSAVNLIAPSDDAVITLTAANIADDSELGIFWSNSVDEDGESVEYTLELCIAEYNECIDSVLSASNLFIPYSDLYEAIADSAGLTMLNIEWNVHTSDGWEVVSSSNGPWSLTVDAGWMLNVDEEVIPEVFALHNNYPNPFNPITNIGYDVPEVSDIRIDIYNLAGQKIRTLVSREHQPGRYKVQWNATNQFGSPVASGMYIYKIHAKNFVSVKKLLLMK